MDDKEARPSGHDFSESAMRCAYEQLYQLRQRAITTESATEYFALNTQATQLERTWLTGPAGWALRWRYLDNAVNVWANDPASARRTLDDAVFGTVDGPPSATMFERDTLLYAAQLTRRGGAAEPSHTSALAYIATYSRTDSDASVLTAHTSWWKAREWISDRSSGDDEAPIEISIAAHDVVSGRRQMLTATIGAIPATEVKTQLNNMTTVLGGTRERDGKEFVDDLHYEVLCDDYHAAMTAANHPGAGSRRIEHKLCADDLRDQLLDFATTIGRQDAVETLADIDRGIRKNASQGTAQDLTMFDEIANHAQHARDQLAWQGINAHYTLDKDPTRIVHVGRSPVEHLAPWYGEVLWLSDPENGHTGEMRPIGRFFSCEALIGALENHAFTTGPSTSHPSPVPADVVRQLREFDQNLRDLDTNLQTSTTIRAAVRSAQPVHLTSRRNPSNSRDRSDPDQRVAGELRSAAWEGEKLSRGAGERDVGIEDSPSTTEHTSSPPKRAGSGRRRERMTRQPNRTGPRHRHI
ncbi:hypothetical protein ACWIGW_40155 [Nocardia brasiliensis]